MATSGKQGTGKHPHKSAAEPYPHPKEKAGSKRKTAAAKSSAPPAKKSASAGEARRNGDSSRGKARAS
jgi:hypothetical protein